MQHRRRALLVATLFVAACGGATAAATDIVDPPAGGGAGDAGASDASSDVRVRDVATDIPLFDERPCREAGTIFECLDCCDELYPPGQVVYDQARDRCSCERCPSCAGSEICTGYDGGKPMSSDCYDCQERTLTSDDPATNCHPVAEEACSEYATCVASRRCMIRSRCLQKPAQ